MNDKKNKITRRKFIAAGVFTASAISGFPFVQTSRAQCCPENMRPIKIGVIGCGGRGTGAADNALTAASDIHLIALADPFPDRIERSLKALNDPKRRGGALQGVEVKEDHIFTGLDCDKKLLETDVDYVCLTGPPGFRPRHFELAVEAGKHVFMEKPVATDPVGVRKILKTAEKAKEKELSVVVGFDNRHSKRSIETVKRIHGGWIGQVLSARSYFNTGFLGGFLKGDIHTDPSWTEMEHQCRNWYYFCWLSGDHIVEQHIHNIDLINWVMGSYPAKAMGVGGRQVRVEKKWGNIYDHFAIDYEYPNGANVLSMCRQWKNCDQLVGNLVVGSKGKSSINLREGEITGMKPWKFEDEMVTPKVYEHWQLIESIRNREPRSEAENAAYSTLTAIMGRESVYTGKVVTWEEMLNSDLDLFPEKIEFGPAPKRPVAMPGQPRPT